MTWAAGMAIGLAIGVALSLGTGNWGLIGVGVAIGVAFAVALDDEKDAGDPKDPDRRSDPHDD